SLGALGHGYFSLGNGFLAAAPLRLRLFGQSGLGDRRLLVDWSLDHGRAVGLDRRSFGHFGRGLASATATTAARLDCRLPADRLCLHGSRRLLGRPLFPRGRALVLTPRTAATAATAAAAATALPLTLRLRLLAIGLGLGLGL